MAHEMTSDEHARSCFPGFHDAERTLQALRRRTTVYERLQQTHFFDDEMVSAVHVDHLARADRDLLRAYDFRGKLLDTLTLYLDEPQQKLEVAEDFDHDTTGMLLLPNSQLSAAIAEEQGWVIDMAHVRDYDPIEDIESMRRKMLVHQLADMAAETLQDIDPQLFED